MQIYKFSYANNNPQPRLSCSHLWKKLITAISTLSIHRPQLHSRPNIFLILATAPHVLHHLFTPLLAHPPLATDNLAQDYVDLPCHIRRISTHVEVGLLLLQQLIDKRSIFLEPLLDVDLLLLVTRKGGD